MATSGLSTGLSGRYATALFEAARDRGALDAVAGSLTRLADALAADADFRRLTTSPLIERDAAQRTVTALAEAMALDPLTANMLKVLARNRRLAQLPAIIRGFREAAAMHRGETTAHVTSAVPLSDEHRAALTQRLRTALRREVSVDVEIDPAILGGLVVQIGSRRIDASIKSKLAAIGAAMKG